MQMRTQGSETSQYLEEKKAIKGTFFLVGSVARLAITIRKKVLAIPLVAASETGIAQTSRVFMAGVVGQRRHLVAESQKMYI